MGCTGLGRLPEHTEASLTGSLRTNVQNATMTTHGLAIGQLR